MGSATFVAALKELGERVGEGHLIGRVEVDQVYAQFQHEGLDLNHPRGGQAKYLEQPLFAGHRTYLERVAANVLDGDVVAAMASSMESLSAEVFKLAPVEFYDLRASGHPYVVRTGAIEYDRPPTQPRLTSAQLAAKNQLRKTGPGGFNGLGALYGY